MEVGETYQTTMGFTSSPVIRCIGFSPSGNAIVENLSEQGVEEIVPKNQFQNYKVVYPYTTYRHISHKGIVSNNRVVVTKHPEGLGYIEYLCLGSHTISAKLVSSTSSFFLKNQD